MKIKTLILAVLASLLPLQMQARDNGNLTVGKGTFLLNNTPFVIKAAEIHYPRIPRPYWDQRIKMCKALGMNTLCLYVFWNIHEQQEGEFNFSGNNDVAEFCRLAQKNGMYVIVRPGPYVCAEWEMGGLPWWLLKKKDIRLREQDPYFMKRVEIFEQKVAEQLAPLTIQRGGPIIMVQVENEYGSYGENKPYVSDIRDILNKYWGKEVLKFQCDWSSNFTKNGLDDLLWTMNFGTGSNIDQQFRQLQQLRPDQPKMCSEFWSGWFDKWGARHETRPAKDMVAGIDEMLSKGISFSLYMTHGGTSFGHWAGANSPGFAPDVTSYDYDAPINEYGQTTPKYYELRNTLQKYSDKKLPKIPEPAAPLISIPQFSLSEFAPIQSGAEGVVTKHDIPTFEDMDMGWGSMIYATTLPEIPIASTLSINDYHDYAQVFIDGKKIGTVNRVKNEKSLRIPAVHKGQQLVILVEAMGRINFGRAIKDYKGITKDVTLQTVIDGNDVTWNIKDWAVMPIPDSYEQAQKALRDKGTTKYETDGKDIRFEKAGYYRGFFNLKKTGDTFINMEAFGKGLVYVNGHGIGRFWNIGPQQTLYIPGCWLKKGRNEVIVLDVVGPEGTPKAFCQDHPELNKLKSNREKAQEKIDLSKYTLIQQGTFGKSKEWQSLKFANTAKGRYLVIEADDAYDNAKQACIAELYTIGTNGKRQSRELWTVKAVSSEDTADGNKTGDKVYDLQESTYWSSSSDSQWPHIIIIDMGTETEITGIDYLPRNDTKAPGSIRKEKIYIK